MSSNGKSRTKSVLGITVRIRTILGATAILLASLGGRSHAAAIDVGPASVILCGKPAPLRSSSVCGFSVIAGGEGPQVAVTGRSAFVASVRTGEEICVVIPLSSLEGACTVTAEALPVEGQAEVILWLAEGAESKAILGRGPVRLEAMGAEHTPHIAVRLITRGKSGEAG